MDEVKAQTVRIPGPLAERLRVTAFMRRVTQTSLILQALTELLDRLDKEQRS
jgi:hypothetical protein